MQRQRARGWPGRIALFVLIAGGALAVRCAVAKDARGGQFIGITNFTAFQHLNGARSGEAIWESPEIATSLSWDQLVVSWNVEMSEAGYLKVEARAIYPRHASGYYVLGQWSMNTNRYPRESGPNQEDADGRVATDTLILKRASQRVQVRLTFGGEEAQRRLKHLGLCLTDTRVAPSVLPANRAAWGKALPVPERSQMAYPNGKVLCSPATVSMMMGYWAQRLRRPELDERDVSEVASAVYDPRWGGTGNWVFNTAYAGSFGGMKAYVSRFSDLSEVEDWVTAGVPVALSVCSDRVHHRGPGPNGHLVVCVGFTSDGDVVVNDPGSARNVRRVYPRADVRYAWSSSHNTVYLIYPQEAEVPRDRFGHWDSSAR
jgi:hypothetical protein